MARAGFSIDEMVYNSIISGKKIYYNDELKTIDYVKLIKNTRLVQIICLPDYEGATADVFLVNQDDVLDWEVSTVKPMLQPNKPKITRK